MSKPKKAKERKPRGRPVEPVPAGQMEAIIVWISEGNPLREYCRKKGAPAWRTVYDWLEKDKDFAARFACARDMGADAIAEQALEIANTPLEGVTRKMGKDGLEETFEDMLGHRKLQVETRLKLLAKWNPKKYGDKLEVDAKVENLVRVVNLTGRKVGGGQNVP